MATFIMLTRLSHDVLKAPSSLLDLNDKIQEEIRKNCAGVEWEANYVVLGPTDYLDIFTAPDIETATKVATIIRTFGHATTEIWPATEWKSFTTMVRGLSPRQ